MARFENTTTTIHAYVIDIENMTKNEVEYTSEHYTRSEKKAEEIIREALDIEDSALVKVFKLEQSNDKKEFDLDKLFEAGFKPFEVLPDENDETQDGFTRIPVTMYRYSGNIFYEDIDTLTPHAEKYCTDWTHQKLTKSYQREALASLFTLHNPYMRVVFVNHIGRNTDNENFVIEFPTEREDEFTIEVK